MIFLAIAIFVYSEIGPGISDSASNRRQGSPCPFVFLVCAENQRDAESVSASNLKRMTSRPREPKQKNLQDFLAGAFFGCRMLAGV
jgi:hypothetical protein